MANPRQRRKRHGQAKVKSSRRQQKNLKKMPPIRGPKALQDSWDNDKTVRQNYAALGLVESFSVTRTSATAPQTQAGTSTGTAGPLAPGRGRIIRDADGNVVGVELPQEPDADDAPEPSTVTAASSGGGDANPVVRALEQLAATSAPKSRHASRGEVALMKELQKTYGDDYSAMAKDRRRNVWQRTAGELRRSMAKSGLIA
ncbi:hypothetical protein EXIGLDRAFT_768128 [Exidia glandulosa HHB12029]|uniref:Nucleolar protein 16 n=1 Tax=Exidia glandulosa HHB12029 TaxID=1314781 RepID=A0A165IG23_EXIGL|nr:hypothetical protein EXIGLDRAFT_768128 [Exidia glandulosa HHB12029]